jgi:hypothetical protein
MEVNISIIKRRKILPQLINPAQIFHKLVREKVVYRVQAKDSALRWVFFACTPSQPQSAALTAPFRGIPTAPDGRVGRPRCCDFLRKSC